MNKKQLWDTLKALPINERHCVNCAYRISSSECEVCHENADNNSKANGGKNHDKYYNLFFSQQPNSKWKHDNNE